MVFDVGAGSGSPSRSTAMQNKVSLSSSASFPLAAYLRFCPGGISYAPDAATSNFGDDGLTDTSSPGQSSDGYYFINSADTMSKSIRSAREADDRLRQFTLLYSQTTTTPHYLPSLSILADAVFGRLTGCGKDKVREWADAMVCQYSKDAVAPGMEEILPLTVDDVFNMKPTAALDDSLFQGKTTTPALLKKILQDAEERRRETEKLNDDIVMMEGCLPCRQKTRRPRPCGYVFKRGDIAWNCRTCQTDPTCVICDDCFRESDHEGHEVFFHRTSPGGCCDCGDAEAWSPIGCCSKHRPVVEVSPNARLVGIDDPMEAIRSAEAGLEAAIETLSDEPTSLPPLLAAALGIVIGAAVNCIQEAFDGSGIGSDAVQWTRRWADEAARVGNNAPYNEDYFIRNKDKANSLPDQKFATLQTFLPPLRSFQGQGIDLPDNYLLYLRLHNDDVHTFDEVINALHDTSPTRRSGSNSDATSNQSLVASLENARDMTHHVDADGQVTVKPYKTIAGAMRGYQRLKATGLQCAVVSNAQLNLELRAHYLCQWLTEVAASHPAAQALVVQAWVQVEEDSQISGIQTWHSPRMIPPWAGIHSGLDVIDQSRSRFRSFPPHLASSYLTREASELLHGIALTVNASSANGGMSDISFLEMTGTVPDFYSGVPYRLPSFRYRKSPHALWGTLPSQYTDPLPVSAKHPLLDRLDQKSSRSLDESPPLPARLVESVYIVDTDLRKQQGERITQSLHPHLLPGLSMISGVGTIRVPNLDSPRRPPLPSPMDWRNLLATSSFRAPMSPILLVLLLDPYPTKQLRAVVHTLFLSLLTNSRFKARFAGCLAVAYRPLSTLFCAGVGTESDTPLHFTVQIFTAGSLVRALAHGPAAERLLLSDKIQNAADQKYQNISTSPASSIGVFLSPIAHIIVRCIHTNLLGATNEVKMIVGHTVQDEQEDDIRSNQSNPALLPALTYVAGQHPLLTHLPAANDDCFLDSRSTKHKRLPHLLRDLEYVIETPGTALRLLLPNRFPVYPGPVVLSHRGEDTLSFPAAYARMLRLAQGMDIQKRKISSGHIEYEVNRWLEAFGLSLNFGSTRDALAESVMNVGYIGEYVPRELDATKRQEQQLNHIREALGNMIAALLREMKLWLYREGMLETGLPVGPGGSHGPSETVQMEALQRSTLHVSSSQFSSNGDTVDLTQGGVSENIAISCATYVKMTETQLTLIENALKIEAAQRLHQQQQHRGLHATSGTPYVTPHPNVPVMGDWLRVPHSPFAGDAMSFHLPLHRALAKCVRSVCCTVVSDSIRDANADHWWKIPILDDSYAPNASGATIESGVTNLMQHPLLQLIRPTLRSLNCRVVWSTGPDCTPQEAQKRRARSRAVSANIAVAKIIHSLADHPLRCLAAAQQIERHLWARNGATGAGMAMNYSTAPLCRQFRDLDLLLVQLSASGMGCGLGVRRVFSLLSNRFNIDGYLCDPELRPASVSTSAIGTPAFTWVNPPRLQDQDHAIILAESFFVTLCVLVTELPPPPPNSPLDDSSLKRSIRRELVHALAAEPRSHSEAMNAATCGISRREETDGMSGCNTAGLFKEAFTSVLSDIAKKKTPSSTRASSGPPLFELESSVCDEYDPSFFHLRRNEHQHAMDIVARLRKQMICAMEESDKICLPLVCPPPKSHPRFLPCRLLLHLDSMDAALRRSLLFAMTNGSWLPPDGPVEFDEQMVSSESLNPSSSKVQSSADVNSTTFSRRILQSQSSSGSFLKRSASDIRPLFSSEVVASSSVSFLEVLQLLTLQVHTLEECASLHRTLADLDDESRLLSSGLSINTYLSRLIRVPESLSDVWALKPFPSGPLKSKGSGENRGSILGLLIGLYEHRSDHGVNLYGEGSGDNAGQIDDGHGGARSLASSGLKWLLRFVHALVQGASSVGMAIKSATTGTRIKSSSMTTLVSDTASSSWSISAEIRVTINGMLEELEELWPKLQTNPETSNKANDDAKKARKAAQSRVMERMQAKLAAFAATIGDTTLESKSDDNESDLCIICRCDDADGENNGPLGFLGHVQRSRVTQIRAISEWRNRKQNATNLPDYFRVVGRDGCQLRESESMESKALICLKKGSIVTVSKRYISTKYDILSRRVFVRHTATDPETNKEIISEGWASVQSAHGYAILSPVISMCYNNTRWGSTRPIIKQCGHAAHLMCVEAHTLSLHSRAAGEQPYDGRFAANISDGEFLCPLCKQLSNILIPRDCALTVDQSVCMEIDSCDSDRMPRSPRDCINGGGVLKLGVSPLSKKALEEFGSHLYTAMSLSGERNQRRKKNLENVHPAVQKWDYEDEEDDSTGTDGVNNILRLLREQLIAWAAVGHSAAYAEASSRGMEKVMPFGIFSETQDPWVGYDTKTKDNHPSLLEMKRTLVACSGLLEVLNIHIEKSLATHARKDNETPIITSYLADILEGLSYLSGGNHDISQEPHSESLWSALTAITAATPCHVARDGSLTMRNEARATATAMWVVKGNCSDASSKSEPPLPLSIRRFLANSQTEAISISEDWGTLSPFANQSDNQSIRVPFRPAVASAFLLTPILAWDLYTFAASILSSALMHEVKNLPTSREILELAEYLMIARLVQSIITPHGFDKPDDAELDEIWSEKELDVEGLAISQLVGHCLAAIQQKVFNADEILLGPVSDIATTSLLGGLGKSILPFARALILLLRSFSACIRERQYRNNIESKTDYADVLLDNFLCNGELPSYEDGFLLTRGIICPLPSQIVNPSQKWISLINRWLQVTIGLEGHQESSSLVSNTSKEIAYSFDSADSSVHPSNPIETVRNSPNFSLGVDGIEANDSVDMVVEFDDDHRGIDRVTVARSVIDEDNFSIEEDDDNDEAEEMVGLENQIGNFGADASASVDNGESSEISSSMSEDNFLESDCRFASVSKTSVIPYQPSLLGMAEMTKVRNGRLFDLVGVKGIASDLSHLGMVHCQDTPTFSLIRLPKSFVEFYNVVNKVKGREEASGPDHDETASAETAICLLTGMVMRSGSMRRSYQRASRPPGTCTVHARRTASGIGMFFLVQKCTVLLMHNNKSAYSPSLYVDEHGEEDPQLRRGRPLYLNEARYRALELLWRNQSIPREVAQIRSTSDRVIRDNWY